MGLCRQSRFPNKQLEKPFEPPSADGTQDQQHGKHVLRTLNACFLQIDWTIAIPNRVDH